MSAEFQLRIVGLLVLGVAALHAFFPRWFAWRTDLARLSLLNRQIFLVHTGFIVLVLIMSGLISLLLPGELAGGGRLGTAVSVGLAAFWGARLLVQFCVYDARLWRGSAAKTGLHALAVVMSAYFTGVYAWAAAGS